MTDRPTTEQDIQATLAVFEEQIRAAADPTLLTEGARVKLGEMYTAAETAGDEPAMTAIQQAWNDIQALAVDAKGAREFALTAMDVLGTVAEQRDGAVKELEDLTRAVESYDTNHPMVNDLVEMVQEAINEEEMLWWDDSLYESVYEHMQDALGYDKEATDHLRVFMDIFGNNIELTPARKREFFTWLDAVAADQELDEGDDDDE